jgi:hypothetical protein
MSRKARRSARELARRTRAFAVEQWRAVLLVPGIGLVLAIGGAVAYSLMRGQSDAAWGEVLGTDVAGGDKRRPVLLVRTEGRSYRMPVSRRVFQGCQAGDLVLLRRTKNTLKVDPRGCA